MSCSPVNSSALLILCSLADIKLALLEEMIIK